jgi:hypothetical protein
MRWNVYESFWYWAVALIEKHISKGRVSIKANVALELKLDTEDTWVSKILLYPWLRDKQ